MNKPELARLAPLAGPELARRHLADFLDLLLPGYERAPHSELICEHLEALERREITRLLVLLPVRHGKSLHVSQAFPAWYLGRRPAEQIILASYGSELAEANSRRARSFLADPRSPFATRISSDSSAVNRWGTTAGGGVIAAGVGGGITGFGADLLVIDDPVKDRIEADSQASRNATWDWLTQVALTRLMPGAVVLLTMTRWHEDDLAGRILASPSAEQWQVLSLPALAEENDPLGRDEGEALWPDWFPEERLRSIARDELDSRAFAALYQQRPTPEQGGLIRREWLSGRYQRLPDRLRVIQAIDTAFKAGVASDYSVIATWGSDGRNFYLLDLWRRQVEFPELVRAIEAEAARHRPQRILIEDSASGQSAIQLLRRSSNLPIIPERPRGSKESRVDRVSGLLEAGQVLLPAQAPWLGDWIEEHVAFPRGRRDDQVDTTSLALERLREVKGPAFRVLAAPPPRPRFGLRG